MTRQFLQNKFFVFLFVFLFVSVWVSYSAGEDLVLSSNARTFETQHESLLIKSMAFACLGLQEDPDGLICNPAMTDKVTHPGLKIEGMISNGYSNLERTQQLLGGTADANTVNALLSGQDTLQNEIFVDLIFVSKYLNARYSPFISQFFSVIRNDANPEVQLYAVQEQDLTVQSGFSWGDLDLGVEFKATNWTFIRQQFFLLDLATPQGVDQLKPQKQNTFFVQPGLNYNLPLPWHPRLSAKAVNSGSIDHVYANFPHPFEVQYGFAISPPMYFGKLDLLVDYKSLNYEEKNSEKLHFGALYRYGVMNLGFGLDSNGASSGIYYALESVNAGILFSTTKLPWKSADYYAQTVYVQVGWQP